MLRLQDMGLLDPPSAADAPVAELWSEGASRPRRCNSLPASPASTPARARHPDGDGIVPLAAESSATPGTPAEAAAPHAAAATPSGASPEHGGSCPSLQRLLGYRSGLEDVMPRSFEPTKIFARSQAGSWRALRQALDAGASHSASLSTSASDSGKGCSASLSMKEEHAAETPSPFRRMMRAISSPMSRQKPEEEEEPVQVHTSRVREGGSAARMPYELAHMSFGWGWAVAAAIEAAALRWQGGGGGGLHLDEYNGAAKVLGLAHAALGEVHVAQQVVEEVYGSALRNVGSAGNSRQSCDEAESSGGMARCDAALVNLQVDKLDLGEGVVVGHIEVRTNAMWKEKPHGGCPDSEIEDDGKPLPLWLRDPVTVDPRCLGRLRSMPLPS
ncbi:hypothetical protein CYMTET_30405, partial [Cymbomonas tetramitiformis]